MTQKEKRPAIGKKRESAIVTGANAKSAPAFGAVVTKDGGQIVTASAAAIVTALGNGPATARSLSQWLDGITYANIRQQLRRLAAAGVVTNPTRGVYALPGACDSGVGVAETSRRREVVRGGRTSRRRDLSTSHRRGVPVVTPEAWAAALWADFEAQDNPHDERAWA
jgi:hypothetical protein